MRSVTKQHYTRLRFFLSVPVFNPRTTGFRSQSSAASRADLLLAYNFLQTEA
jgi:hypothetical protein